MDLGEKGGVSGATSRALGETAQVCRSGITPGSHRAANGISVRPDLGEMERRMEEEGEREGGGSVCLAPLPSFFCCPSCVWAGHVRVMARKVPPRHACVLLLRFDCPGEGTWQQGRGEGVRRK